jgi:2-isopropylmalate synthase
MPIPHNYPIIGENAFTHCAGVHTHAAIVNPLHYQSLDPAIIGRKMEICLDHMSGASAVRYALEKIGYQEPSTSLVESVLEQIKIIGETGRKVNDLKEVERIARWCEKEVASDDLSGCAINNVAAAKKETL